MTGYVIASAFAVLALLTLAAAPRRASVEGFFAGAGADGAAPGLWTLVLSQVTTWIFARSLMNAAILGYFYGMAGTLAYAAYYGSFLTGGWIVGRMRGQGAVSVQDWLRRRFGAAGSAAYNLVIGLRLLSEVFANLLVVGLIFGAILPGLSGAGDWAVVLVGLLALGYSAWGGLSAALRTDVAQMLLFLTVFAISLVWLMFSPGFSTWAALTAPGVSGSRNGWILLAVAALQVFSYPVHDPVMMDRGFVADRATTRASFLHAFWLSTLCILGFGLFGVQASLAGAAYEGELIGTWAALFPAPVFALLMLSLLISALSTLDSALSSAARLTVEELRLAPRSLWGGRLAMAAFALAGGGLTLWGAPSLFDAVAVSGTASMFLTPVLVLSLIGGRSVPVWSFLTAFVIAMGGAAAYLLRDWAPVAAVLPDGHKYEQLLAICLAVLTLGFAAVLAGARRPGVAAPG